MNRHISIVLLAAALTMTMLSGCGRNNRKEESALPTVTPAAAEPTATVEPTATTEPAVVNEPFTAAEPAAAAEPVVTAEPAATPGTEAVNERFTGVMGSEFTVPEGFVQLDESPSIGYQYTFWHPDYEIRIVVYEIAPGYIPEGAYETDYHIARNNPDVTYFDKGENWFVQSGYDKNGEEIFYSKESSTNNGLKTFWISYPTAKREFGDSITAEFEASFRF